MDGERVPSWIFITTLLMIFVSGCWTIATIGPFLIRPDFRPYTIVAVTIANLAFLLSLMTSMFSYAKLGDQSKIKQIMVYLFSSGILSLIISIVIFSISYLTGYFLNNGPPIID